MSCRSTQCSQHLLLLLLHFTKLSLFNVFNIARCFTLWYTARDQPNSGCIKNVHSTHPSLFLKKIFSPNYIWNILSKLYSRYFLQIIFEMWILFRQLTVFREWTNCLEVEVEYRVLHIFPHFLFISPRSSSSSSYHNHYHNIH